MALLLCLFMTIDPKFIGFFFDDFDAVGLLVW
jgi:hypothetical protein